VTLVEATRRAALYVGLALAGLTVIALLVAFSIYTGIEIRGSWLALTMWTALVFWVVVKSSKQHWRRPKYWFVLAAILAVHLVAFGMVLRTYPDWQPIWFAPTSIVEAGLLGGIVEWCFPDRATPI